ncbi:MAG: hypothetical protein ACUVX9_19015, partial [Anaerolineae bacterium]
THSPPTEQANSAPPGAEIAFLDADGRLWLLGLDGSRRTQLTTEGRAAARAWSPDGSTLAYGLSTAASGPWLLMLCNPESQGLEVLAQFDQPIAALAWSPDGSNLAIECGTSIAGSLDVLEVSSGRVLHHQAIVGGCAWSPDGSRLVFGLRRPLDKPISIETGDSISLAVLEIGQAEPQTILEGTSQALYLPKAWLPDGRVLYQRLDWDEQAQTGEWTLWTVRLRDGAGDPEPAHDLPLAYDAPALLARLPGEFQDPATTAEFSWSSKDGGSCSGRGLALLAASTCLTHKEGHRCTSWMAPRRLGAPRVTGDARDGNCTTGSAGHQCRSGLDTWFLPHAVRSTPVRGRNRVSLASTGRRRGGQDEQDVQDGMRCLHGGVTTGISRASSPYRGNERARGQGYQSCLSCSSCLPRPPCPRESEQPFLWSSPRLPPTQCTLYHGLHPKRNAIGRQPHR